MTLRWGSFDQLGLEGLLGLALVAALAVGLGGPALLLLTGGDVTADVELDRSALQGVPDVTGAVRAAVVLRHADGGEVLLSVLPLLLGTLLIALTLLRLLAVTRSLRTGQVFSAANVRRLRDVALLVLAGGSVLQVVDGVCRSELARRTVAGAHSGISVQISILPVGVGLLVAFLAEVMRRDVVLRDEVDGLV